jgi:hypothetical protein
MMTPSAYIIIVWVVLGISLGTTQEAYPVALLELLARVLVSGIRGCNMIPGRHILFL